MPYNHKDIEAKWIKNWSDSNIYKTPIIEPGDKKKYILEAFPYPSGDGLHVGHALPMTAGDITSRFYRMNGYNILHPMGWDSFGLPTENFAKKRGLHPQDITNNAIANFTKQIHRLGIDYDWSKELSTSSSEYYKWTQWFFQLLYKRGLAYKKEALVNWDPVDMTVLANEQVTNGIADRSGAKVEQKMMSQWFFRITDYAERLLTGLEDLDWPESTKLMQKNWIGKSVGAEVDFEVINPNYNYLFLHGWEGSAQSNNLPKVKEIFESKGLSIQIPNLPNSANPNIEQQVQFVLDNCKIDASTVIVGHSLGVAVGLKVVEKLDLKIAKFISVAGFVDNNFRPQIMPEGIDDPFGISKVDFDFDKISSNCAKFVGVWSDDDQFITPEQTQNLEKSLNFKVTKTSGAKHLNDLSQKIIQDHIFDKISVFTTAHDTIFGVTFLVIAPEHNLVDGLTSPKQFEAVADYKQKSKQKSQFERTEINKDKTGIFTGSYATNPLNGNRIPIWIADYVLTSYGTGAVMAVPGEDERDFEFATKYNLPIVYTNHTNQFVSYSQQIKANKAKYTLINSAEFDGMTYQIARPKILEKLQSIGAGKSKVTYRLRDWSIGRQRYWGCPIPVIYDQHGEESLIPESDLPVILPQDLDLSTGMIKPLRSNTDFINSGSQYGKGWTREGDTMDTFVCSSWYFFRYCSGNIDNAFADPKDMKIWMPVDQYIIGAEHSTMHLLYARFFTKVLFDAGYIDFDEPFAKMRHQGLILGPDGAKMSKSIGNVINPDEIFDEYGADTLRMYEMFMGPFDQPKPWSTSSIKGVRRFLDRVWNLQERVYNGPESYLKLEQNKIMCGPKTEYTIETGLNKLIKKIGKDIESYGFNTCVSEFMKFINLVEDTGAITTSQFQKFLIVLSPFAPFITEELWSNIAVTATPKLPQKVQSEKSEVSNSPLEGWQPQVDGVDVSSTNSIHLQQWPIYDPKLLIQNTVKIGVQINGKARGEVELM